MTVIEVLFLKVSFIVIGAIGVFIAGIRIRKAKVFWIVLVGALCVILSGSVSIILLRSLGSGAENSLLVWMEELGIIVALILFFVSFFLLGRESRQTSK